MSRQENAMDELPDLRSDADVDALMARLRARLAPPPPPDPAGVVDTRARVAAGEHVADLVAVQEAFADTVVRAMTTMVEALEELTIDGNARGTPAAPRVRRRTSSRRKRP
jgi:hypothetical protein